MRPDESRKVVVEPDVLVLVEVLPVESLTVAFLPASEDVGSAKARAGIRRNRISFMEDWDDGGAVFLHLSLSLRDRSHTFRMWWSDQT